MAATPLSPRSVEKVWGRTLLPPRFRAFQTGAPVGEIWFEAEADAETGEGAALLVKYLFTSQALSVQVHPGDEAARRDGHACGKDEAWLILSAEPGAVIGLGPRAPVTEAALREAALDGSIDRLIDWKPVRAGDFFYSPAGTVHAIGAGITLVEIQQNCDLTYRLYDHGRPRALHLDAALAVSDFVPWRPPYAPRRIGPGRELLATGGRFTVERWRSERPLHFDAGALELSVVPLAGLGRSGQAWLEPGVVARAGGEGEVRPDGRLDLLVAYPGPVRLGLVRWAVRARAEMRQAGA